MISLLGGILQFKIFIIACSLYFWTCEDMFPRCDVEILGECYSVEQTTSINLSSKELTRIPEEIFQLKNLTSLSLANNKLEEIPIEICYLNELKFLYLNDNQITHMQYGLSRLIILEFFSAFFLNIFYYFINRLV